MEVQRAESLNESPVFARALADIVAQHLDDYESGKVGPVGPLSKICLLAYSQKALGGTPSCLSSSHVL